MNARIHPLAQVSRDSTIGSGAVVEAYCVVGYPTEQSREGTLGHSTVGQNARLRQFTIIYHGTACGDRLQTGHHTMIREHCSIGDQVSIGTSSVVEHHVTIGSNVRIHSGAFVPEYTVIEDGVFVGPNAVLTNALYPLSRTVKQNLVGPHISRGAIIGANATILPGVVIGARSIVGAGAVVTHDTEPGTVVAGNPARRIGTIDQLPYD